MLYRLHHGGWSRRKFSTYPDLGFVREVLLSTDLYRVDDELLDIVGQIYDCAIDPANWTQTLQRIAVKMSGFAATLSLHGSHFDSFRLDAQWNMADDYRCALEGAMPINPVLTACWYHDVNQPFGITDFVGRDELRATRFFKEAMSVGNCQDAAVMVLTKSAARFGGLAIHRDTEQPCYTKNDLELLRLIGPHLRRAVTITDMLDAKTLERDRLSSVLNLISAGVFLTDGQAHVIYANAAATRHLDAKKALRKRNGMLVACDPASSRDLRKAILDAASGAVNSSPSASTTIAVKGVEGADLAVWVLPLDSGLRRELGGTFTATVAIFVRELGDTSAFPAELFIRQYGITPAECRLLFVLVQGLSLQEAVEALGVSMPTAKTHLSRLFAKTGVDTQASLMRLAVSALSPAR